MASYRDIVRDDRRYTADKYLEIHRQLANNIKRDLGTNRNSNVGQAQGSGDQPQGPYSRDQGANRYINQIDNPQRLHRVHREPDPRDPHHYAMNHVPRLRNRGQVRAAPPDQALNPYAATAG